MTAPPPIFLGGWSLHPPAGAALITEHVRRKLKAPCDIQEEEVHLNDVKNIRTKDGCDSHSTGWDS